VDADDHQPVRLVGLGDPAGVVASVRAGLGARGVFIALTVAYSTLAVVSAVLFRRGRWKQQSV
jgi:MATE family, multidrug efflux pump